MNIQVLGIFGVILVLAGWWMHVQALIIVGLFLGAIAFVGHRLAGGSE